MVVSFNYLINNKIFTFYLFNPVAARSSNHQSSSSFSPGWISQLSISSSWFIFLNLWHKQLSILIKNWMRFTLLINRSNWLWDKLCGRNCDMVASTVGQFFGLRNCGHFGPDGIVAKFLVDEIVTISEIVYCLYTADWSLLRPTNDKALCRKIPMGFEININGKPTKSLWGFLVYLPYEKEIKNNLRPSLIISIGK